MNCPCCRDHWQVMHSAAGWYIGTQHDGMPVCRVSEYHKRKSEVRGWLLLIISEIGDSKLRECEENKACPGYDEVVNGHGWSHFDAGMIIIMRHTGDAKLIELGKCALLEYLEVE